jgi:hypothetical protein
MSFQLQAPVVVDVIRQPPITPEITYPQVILSAFGVAGGIMLLAVLAGLVTGGIIIFFKKRAEATAATIDTGHATLGI